MIRNSELSQLFLFPGPAKLRMKRSQPWRDKSRLMKIIGGSLNLQRSVFCFFRREERER